MTTGRFSSKYRASPTPKSRRGLSFIRGLRAAKHDAQAISVGSRLARYDVPVQGVVDDGLNESTGDPRMAQQHPTITGRRQLVDQYVDMNTATDLRASNAS